MKVIGIYKITNSINNKIYIGSSVDIKARKYLHLSMLKNNKHHSPILQRVYNKYGKNSLKFEIIELCKEINLLEREQYYIDTLKPEYNCCQIAGRTNGLISNKRKPIIQYDLDGNFIQVFNCLQDIMTTLSLTNSSKITKVCRLERRKAYNFVWRYLGDDFIPFSYRKRKGVSIAEINDRGEIIKQWETIKECAEELNTTSSLLCNILSTKTRAKTFKGKIFKRI
jgi:hypothetical protein